MKILETDDKEIKKFYNMLELIPSISEKQEKQIGTLNELQSIISTLTESHEKLQQDFTEYVEFNPIMIVGNKSKIKQGMLSTGSSISYIMFDIQDIDVAYNNSAGNEYYSCQQGAYLDFDLRKFKYLRQLININFSACPFKNLEFLADTPSVKSITLYNMPELVSVTYLTRFPNLEAITISEVCNVKDLCTLTKCTGLKNLKLAKGTNTGCFPEIIDFKITME